MRRTCSSLDTGDADQQEVVMTARSGLRDWTQPAESLRAFSAPFV